MTAAEPNLGYFQDLIGRLDVTIEDVTDEYGVLAVQGPRSREILAKVAPEVDGLAFFGHTPGQDRRPPVTISRTGYTGDLGYEVCVGSDDALEVLDAIIEAGQGHGIHPVRRGSAADDAHRGRPGADQRRVPVEPLRVHRPRPRHRQGARLRLDAQGHRRRRPAVHRPQRDPQGARRQDVALGECRPAGRLAGLQQALHRRRPHPAQGRDPARLRVDAVRRRGQPDRLRHRASCTRRCCSATSRWRGSARRSAPSARSVNLELTINHQYQTVAADVARLPLFNPARKTA